MKIWTKFENRIKICFAIAACCAAQVLAPLPCRAAALQDSPASTSSQAAQYEAAARESEQQVKLRPQSAKAWSNLGAVRAMQGNCATALPALSRARALDSSLFVPWYFSGYCHLAIHEDQTALKELERATRLNPKDPNAWYLEAEAASNLNRLPLSLDAALHSMQFDSRRAQSYYLAGQAALGLAKALYANFADDRSDPFAWRLWAERFANQGVWGAPISDYQKAQGLSPRAPDIAFDLGSVYLEAGKYEEAENEFRRCLKLWPGSPWAKLRLALALAADSRTSQAEEILKTIAPASLESPSEWQDLAAAEDMAGQAENARRRLAEAESLFPNFPAWQDWGQRLSSETGNAPAKVSFEFERPGTIALSVSFLLADGPKSGDFVRALFPDSGRFDSFRKAFLSGNASTAAAGLMPLIRQKPSNSERAFAIGQALHRIALDFFERLEIEYPDSEAGMVLAAQNDSESGDQAKAIEIYRELLRRNGPSADILRNLAEVYWKRTEWDQAVPLLEQLAKIDPHDPTAYINLGRIYLYRNNAKEAERCFRIAARIQPDMYEAHFGLGEVLERTGDFKNAAAELKLAEQAEPRNPRPHYFLSQVYRMSGEKNLAVEEMANFQRLQAQNGPGVPDQGSGLVPLD